MRRTKTVIRNNGSQQIVVLDAIVSRHHKAAFGTVTRLAATTRDTPTFETTIVKAVDNTGVRTRFARIKNQLEEVENR